MTTTLLTLDEVAERLKLSRRTVNRLVADGHIRVIHPVPKAPRITERELDAFLAPGRGSARGQGVRPCRAVPAARRGTLAEPPKGRHPEVIVSRLVSRKA